MCDYIYTVLSGYIIRYCQVVTAVMSLTVWK